MALRSVMKDVEVIHRSASVANIERAAGVEGLREIVFGPGDGRIQACLALGEFGRDGRR